jgi:hypothetical protein
MPRFGVFLFLVLPLSNCKVWHGRFRIPVHFSWSTTGASGRQQEGTASMLPGIMDIPYIHIPYTVDMGQSLLGARGPLLQWSMDRIQPGPFSIVLPAWWTGNNGIEVLNVKVGIKKGCSIIIVASQLYYRILVVIEVR